MARNLILILGDQLSPNISALRHADPRQDHIVMAEVMSEASYVPHHKKKIAFVFSAMRHFAQELRDAGWQLSYTKLDDPDNTGSLKGEMQRAVQALQPERIMMTEPGEHRLLSEVQGWATTWAPPFDILEDTRFIASHAEFQEWAKGRKQLRMEYFYREMRRKTGLLMDGDHPEGGKWNYDNQNRKPGRADLFMPDVRRFTPDRITLEALALVDWRFPDNFGTLERFWFGVTAGQAEAAAEHFIAEALPLFGDFQDAMLRGEPFLYHSVLSLYINIGLLDPLALCRKVDAAYRTGHAPLNAAEGFIRQIIGWREYMRGIYWLKMPDYVNENFLEAHRPLPTFYWTTNTDMTCMKAALTQTRDEAYAHHIQRLMVTGNFALLAGIDPREVHEWYLSVYADAYEWVELPNTLGMSQFADGGLLGSKPYASSGNYINKMSDYCRDCCYNVARKTGVDACPFNTLYWDFLDRNATKLRGNPRLAFPYRSWDKMGADKQQAYRDTAKAFLDKLR